MSVKNEMLDKIGSLEKKWLIGAQPSLKDTPEEWHPLLSPLKQEQQSLYTLILSQYQQLAMTQPQPTSELTLEVEIPPLDLPCIENSLRPSFNNILNWAKSELRKVQPSPLISLLDNRQVSAHPQDWLPTHPDDFSSTTYLPWLYRFDQASTWQQRQDTADEDLDWAGLEWNEKFTRLKQFRQQQPDLAREFIQKLAQDEKAEKRLALYGLLRINLSEQDLDVLKSCFNDASKKISLLAKQLSARVGYDFEDDDAIETAQELAERMTVKKKLLGKKVTITPIKFKSGAQEEKRINLLEKVSIKLLAQKLDITVSQLLKGWDLSAFNRLPFYEINFSFFSNAIEQLPLDEQEQLLDHLADSENEYTSLYEDLIKQLAFYYPAELLTKRFHSGLGKPKTDMSFLNWLSLIPNNLGVISWPQIQSSFQWKILLERIEEALKDNHYLNSGQIMNELMSLGLMVPQEVAQKIVEHLISLGMIASDPALDALKLNIALPQSNK